MGGARAETRWAIGLAKLLGAGAALVALYWGFAGQMGGGEWAVGLGAAGAALAAAIAMRRSAGLEFRPGARALLALARLPGKVLADSGRVLLTVGEALLGRPPRERWFEVPFDAGGADARSAGRRAVVAFTMNAAPNTVVVAIDAGAGLIRVHQLRPTATPPGGGGGDREYPS